MAQSTAQNVAGAAFPNFTRSFTLPNGDEMEVSFPRRHTKPADMTDAKLLRFDQHLAHTFLAPFAKKMIADKKTPTQAEVETAWLAFELGAARAVGTGSTIRERAAAIVADQVLAPSKTYMKGEKGKMTERILSAIDAGTALPATVEKFDAALAQLKAEAEAKRGTATKKESVSSDTIQI